MKLEKLMKERDIEAQELATLTGFSGRVKQINSVLDGESSVTAMSYEVLSSIARALGVPIEELLDDYDLDGTSSQIASIKKIIDRIRLQIEKMDAKRIKERNYVVQIDHEQVRFDDEDIEEKLKSLEKRKDVLNKKKKFYQNPGFIFGINIDKLEWGDGSVTRPYPFGKKNYDFINPKSAHSEEEYKPSYILNREYYNDVLKGNKWQKGKLPLCINALASKTIANCPALFVYTPMKNGGDLKLALTVLDKRGNTRFTEVYGVEWIEKKNKEDIVYYKSQYKEPFTKENIRTCEKWQIGEAEFYKGIRSQFTKFHVPRS